MKETEKDIVHRLSKLSDRKLWKIAAGKGREASIARLIIKWQCSVQEISSE